MSVQRWQDHAIKVGSTVTLIGRKSRAVVVRDLYKVHAINKWGGWVEIEPPLSGFTRYHRDELELIK